MAEGLKVLIADDEALARKRLADMIIEIQPETTLIEATSGTQAITQTMAHTPNIAMLDIRMPGMDGLEVARHMGRLEQPPWIIFTTAWQQYAMSAFEQHAIAYLLKPVRCKALQAALWRAEALDQARFAALQQSLGMSRRFLSVQTRRQLELIPIQDILYLRAEQKLVLLGHHEGEKVLDESLQALEEEFSGYFLRVHRNALVAPRHIKTLQKGAKGWQIVLQGSPVRLTVSRRLVTQVKTHITKSHCMPEAQATDNT